VFILLALASAGFYGAADFLGGIATRRAQTVVVTLVSQCAGLILLALFIPALPLASPERNDYLWGIASGFAGSAGVALLYRALAVGTMSIVAPITAVCAVAVPVLIAFALGERPGVLPVAGIAMAIVAIALVSRGESMEASHPSRGVLLALIAGVAVGVFFFCLERTGPDAGLWPLIAGRLTSVPIFAVLTLAGRHSLRMGVSVVRIAVACGALDMLANALYLVATRHGPLSLVATLASLYPASTVLLARLTLGERLTPAQMAGVMCAMLAVLLIVGNT
jgi:drug/metabolite transporter (DMT)-like permease